MPPSGGNAYLILAHQYIATNLSGLDPGPPPNPPLPGFINENMTRARELLIQYQGDIDIDKNDYPEDRAEAILIAGYLDDFNNGLLAPPGPGWPHCDDWLPPLILI
jgi:hypothetical protein